MKLSLKSCVYAVYVDDVNAVVLYLSSWNVEKCYRQ